MSITFDIIGDLNLTSDDDFDWSNNVTSLFCLITGNISNDLDVVETTLKHLSSIYLHVFYIDGGKEHEQLCNRKITLEEIRKLCKTFTNVVFLHDNVIIMNGSALVGVNGWCGNYSTENFGEPIAECFRYNDFNYLNTTIEKLQLHLDVTQIIVVSNSIPNETLSLGSKTIPNMPILNQCLSNDHEKKVTHWIYGGSTQMVNTILDGVTYISNPKCEKQPYWAKRLEI